MVFGRRALELEDAGYTNDGAIAVTGLPLRTLPARVIYRRGDKARVR